MISTLPNRDRKIETFCLDLAGRAIGHNELTRILQQTDPPNGSVCWGDSPERVERGAAALPRLRQRRLRMVRVAQLPPAQPNQPFSHGNDPDNDCMDAMTV